jgi:tRNA threonylcarbamoyladenosine biosynthesis protein TsaE
VEAGLQPGLQPGLGVAEVDAGDADLGESQLPRPPPQPLHERLPAEVMLSRMRPDSRKPALPLASLARRGRLRRFARHWPRSRRWPTPSSTCTATLGAGKTTFVRHLLRALGVQGASRARPTPCSSRYEAPGLSVHALRLLPLQRPARVGGRRLSRVFAAPA